MPATPLPSTGDAPAPKTCDASGMAMIHRVFRRDFAGAPALVRGVRAGDARHAEVVAVHLRLISRALHAHHEGEDARLWPALDERAPACAAHVERMQEQHRAILAPLASFDDAIPAWAAGGDPVALLAALDGINAALAVHLPDEEATIVPVMETTLTQAEVDWFGEHGRKATPRGQTWNFLGGLLAAQPDGGTEFLRTELPPPVRLLWRVVGRPKYERTLAALEGRR